MPGAISAGEYRFSRKKKPVDHNSLADFIRLPDVKHELS